MTLLKGWRTIVFNILSGALLIMSLPEFVAVLPPEWASWIALANVVGNMALRGMTTTPIGRSRS